MKRPEYLTIHSVPAMQAKQFSIFRANIENTPEKMELAKSLYPAPQWWIEEHDGKNIIRAVN